MDPVFNPQITAMNEEYRKAAEQEMLGMIPDDLSQSYALLSDVIDYSDSDGYKNGELKDFANGDTEILLEIGKEPGMTGSLKNATSISDALVLQYYEEPDETAAAFGRNLTYDQWREIGGIKDLYTDVLFSTPSVSVQIANPLLQVIDAELGRNDRKFTFLCGHDSNICSVLGSLGVHDYASENSIETKTPIGGKLVFEKWEDTNGSDYIRMRLVYQNKDQLRGMPLLTPDNPPSSLPLDIPGLTPNSDGLIPYEDFNRFLDERIDAFDELKKKYGITDPTTSYVLQIPDTADR
jgi:glucose-1-phosphatase